MKVEVTARNYEIDDKVRSYLDEKLTGLEKYLPRHMRDNSHAEAVLLDDPNGREDNRYVCDIVMNVDGQTLVSREGAINMFAAIDIVEAKLKAQTTRFKEKVTTGQRRLRMLSRWTTKAGEADGTTEPLPADSSG
jgi:ribosomal subunit interface protein